jgi:hypothetical protein
MAIYFTYISLYLKLTNCIYRLQKYYIDLVAILRY